MLLLCYSSMTDYLVINNPSPHRRLTRQGFEWYTVYVTKDRR